jgi:ribonuclease HI
MAAFYVLNTDASIGPSGKAAIGVVLRQKLRQGKPLTVIAFISKRVDTDDIATAEYLALIEGLRLAVPYEPTTLRVFTDSNFIPDQIHAPDPKFKSAAMKPLYNRAWRLINRIGKERVKVLWVPRDMNTEADQRAADAFFIRSGDVWVRPTST